MNTDNHDWIKMSDRKPTEADLPVWVFPYSDGKAPALFFNTCCCALDYLTHWKPAKADLPAPPKPGPTQREEDEAALVVWDEKEYIGTVGPTNLQTRAWHAALAHRDTQNRKDLEELKNAPVWDPFLISKLRKRCGLD